jgi:hypothetical protein
MRHPDHKPQANFIILSVETLSSQPKGAERLKGRRSVGAVSGVARGRAAGWFSAGFVGLQDSFGLFQIVDTKN